LKWISGTYSEVDDDLCCVWLYSNDDRRGNNDVGSYFMTRSILNLSDLFWYWDPYYYQRRDSKSDRKLSFVESIFSFVFGDPDPNANFEVDRWAQASFS